MTVENEDGEEEVTAEGVLPEMAELVLTGNPIATANGGEKLKKIMQGKFPHCEKNAVKLRQSKSPYLMLSGYGQMFQGG